MSDGISFAAKSLGGDPVCDPNVLLAPNIPKEKLTVLPFADSKQLKVNEKVVAINPFVSNKSATVGKITVLGRVVTPNITRYVYPVADLIQTDIKLNSSDYGRPLINMEGEIIGFVMDTSLWQFRHLTLDI